MLEYTQLPIITHLSTIKRRFCVRCQKKEIASRGKWGAGIAGSQAGLCLRCLKKEAEPLARILLFIPDEEHAGEEGYVISSGKMVANTLCPQYRRPIERRPWEIGIAIGPHYSIAGGEDVAPSLSMGLHKFYGTDPQPRLLPEVKKPDPPAPAPDPEIAAVITHLSNALNIGANDWDGPARINAAISAILILVKRATTPAS